ncbi:DUF1501 domain-containing protein [Nocardioides marinquilinus]|uniref:DUF1501 domain-containing protein n=1 Tax=Nocardioides marinquilinus TaxID=1210400 RepID=A0ABP9PIS6_9ACTN
MTTSPLDGAATTRSGRTTGGRACGCPEFRMSRRRLLGTAMATGGALAGAQMFGDAFRQVAYGGEPGGNVVVVLSLRGGSDGLSLVVPRNVDSARDHDHLTGYRSTIVVPQGALLDLGAERRFGLHPALDPLLPMWQAGSFGAVHAVGLPAPNRSHFDAMEEVEDADPGSRLRVGWINRVIGFDGANAPEEAVALGTSLLPTSMVGPSSALGVNQVGDLQIAGVGTSGEARRQSLSQMWRASGTPLARGVKVAVDSTTKLARLAENVDDDVHGDLYPDGPLRGALANTAALIREDVGTKMIAIDYGDWDMHEGLGSVDGGWMTDHLGHFAASLKVFFDDLGSHAGRVTVVTISEFGRRVEENGSGGVDHGYGNAMLLLGAGVAGGAVRGDWPGLAPGDLVDGDLAMRQDFRDVLWEVLDSRLPGVQRDAIFPGFRPTALGTMRA